MKEFVCNDNRPHFPDGEYEAQCTRYNTNFCFGKTRKTFLDFVILSQGEHHGKKIFMAFNMPYDKKIKSGSKYYKNWVMVNGWNKPSRNAKMSPRIFINNVYKIKTRTVKPKHNGKPMPDNFWYSVVDEIIEVIAR